MSLKALSQFDCIEDTPTDACAMRKTVWSPGRRDITNGSRFVVAGDRVTGTEERGSGYWGVHMYKFVLPPTSAVIWYGGGMGRIIKISAHSPPTSRWYSE
jgi:hypothetical protein